MKTPTWVTVTGICLILFGGCSVSKNIQAIMLPDVLKMQQSMVKNISGVNTYEEIEEDTILSSIEEDTAYVHDNQSFNNVANEFEKIMYMSEFTKTWMVRLGYVGIVVSFFYILSGIFLLMKKMFSIKLVYIALLLSIVFSITQSIIILSDSSGGLMSKASSFGNIFSIVVDLTLIIVVFTSDKSIFENNNEMGG